MARLAKIVTNNKRKKMVAKYAKVRAALKAAARDPRATEAAKQEARDRLDKLPRNSSPVRVRNRCEVTGRARGFYRKFGLSRIALRLYALRERGE